MVSSCWPSPTGIMAITDRDHDTRIRQPDRELPDRRRDHGEQADDLDRDGSGLEHVGGDGPHREGPFERCTARGRETAVPIHAQSRHRVQEAPKEHAEAYPVLTM